MLKKHLGIDNNNEKNINETKVIGIILLIVMIVIVFGRSFSSSEGEIKKDNNNITESNIELINKISNNYDLEIIKREDGISYTMNYSRDKDIVSSGIKLDKDYAYIEYENKLYTLNDNEELIISENNVVEKYFDKKFYDINIIVNLYKRSKYDSGDKYIYKLSDYFKEYNYKYNTNFKPNEDKNNVMYVTNSGKYIKFVIDYSEIYKIIYKENKSIIYEITISNINLNDYEYITKVLNKNND